MLPPPVQYPPRRRRRWIIAAVAVLAVAAVVGVIAAVVLTGGREEQPPAGAMTQASAQTAIQDYLDALSNGDDETVARNTLCGLFDAAKERRADLALAGLSSDAFRKQYSSAEVTSIDKMVLWSPTQAQVLFTMRVEPASGSRGQPAAERRRTSHRPVAVYRRRDPGVLVPAADGWSVLTATTARVVYRRDSVERIAAGA